jgi:hypothetical protein
VTWGGVISCWMGVPAGSVLQGLVVTGLAVALTRWRLR